MEEYREKQLDMQSYGCFIDTVKYIQKTIFDYYSQELSKCIMCYIDKAKLLNTICREIKLMAEQPHQSYDNRYPFEKWYLLEIILTTSLPYFYDLYSYEPAYDKFIDFENELRKEYNYYESLNPRFYKYRDYILMKELLPKGCFA